MMLRRDRRDLCCGAANRTKRPPQHGSRRRGARRIARALVLPLAALFLLAPAAPAMAVSNPFDICSDPEAPEPEVAGTGLDTLIRPPGENPAVRGPNGATLYEQYGMAGQRWHTTELGCADMLAKVGNQGANLVFDIAKAIDRTTITLYQAAYSESLLDDLAAQVSTVVQNLRDFLYLPYLTPLILVAAMWAAWHGLVRRRATMTFEGTIWMIIAVVCALWFLNRPQQLMEAGNTVVTGMSNAAVTAVGQATPSPSSTCVAPGGGNGNGVNVSGQNATVRQASNTLWSTLVCRPWLAGEFGLDQSSSKLVEDNGAKLLSAQAFAVHEARNLPASSDRLASGPVQTKQEQYAQVRTDIKENYGAVYPLFQGKQWGTRVGIALAALLAAVFAGLLVLVVAITLIVLKVAFLMLMMVGPLFLLAGVHPGIGRVIALRWFEMLLGTLLKQVIVAVVLAVLLLGYSVVLAPDSPLPWGIQILLIALLALVAFIYRKPFQHLFASVGMAGAYTGERTVQTDERERTTVEDGTAVTRRAPPQRVHGVGARRRRLGEAMAGSGTGLGARLNQRWSDSARGRAAAAAGDLGADTVSEDGGGPARGAPAAKAGQRETSSRSPGGLSWTSSGGSRPAAAPTPRREPPPLRPQARRPESAPLPFWLQPRERRDDGHDDRGRR
ncbi:MAG: hypothetical protein GEV03_12195 [Streptosporangiales bacterium]|nr:hypothetical protein [Streptosporangiales bacterium]